MCQNLKIPLMVFILALIIFDLTCSTTMGFSANDERNYDLTNQGAALYKEKKFSEAIEKLTQQLKVYPRDWITLSWRAAAYIESGQYPAGLKDLDLLLKIEPVSQHPTTYSWYGNVHREMGNLDKAIEAFKKAVRSRDAQIYHLQLGRTYLAQKNYDKAIEEFSLTINAPETPEIKRAFGISWQTQCYLSRAECYYHKNLPEEAISDLKKAAELMPRYAHFLNNDQEALVFFDLPKRNKIIQTALEAAQKAETEGNFTEAFAQLEKAYSWILALTPEEKNLVDKITELYAKLTVKPELPESARKLCVQAQVLAENKKYLQAIDLYENALEICPWHAQSYFNIALLSAEARNTGKAIRNMQRYLKLEPEALDAREAQDRIYEWQTTLK